MCVCVFRSNDQKRAKRNQGLKRSGSNKRKPTNARMNIFICVQKLGGALKKIKRNLKTQA